jgi:hypothetical protein
MNDVLIKLTGLWERERRGNPGNTYWSGRLGAAKILVFKNNRKESDSDPDYNVFITEPSPPRQDRPRRRPQRVATRLMRPHARSPMLGARSSGVSTSESLPSASTSARPMRCRGDHDAITVSRTPRRAVTG